jgi:Fe-S cluster assembly protein SufD
VKFDFTVRHLVGGSHSRQVFRGIVGGSARAEFDGLVYVAKDAQKTEAYQENHSILLSEGAVAESHPQLEIYADDVKCSHGATTGYLNPDELFYLRSRGIPEVEARKMQMISFVSPVISHLPEDVKEQILSRL